ncbi:hypothetical protein ABEQ27_12220, partial [Cutibacterium acnes]
MNRSTPAALALVMSLLCIGVAAQTQTELLPLAMKGDYQAQRNLAFSYASPEKGERSDPIASCAWYLVILQSGSSKVGSADAGNVRTYCGPLQQEDRVAAEARA